ncbi:MAG: type IV conjugative transfer system protein TraL [Betaproteobacteria bacterium]|nr:type IV conjugative transfer system protein TraL [Betaproteobacteria bacterium]
MAVSNSYYVYQHLDDPEIIGIWTMDEFVAAIAPLFIGLLLRHSLIGAVCGGLAWWGLRRLKSGKSLAWVYGLVYWHVSGLIPLSRSVPPASHKVMVG